MIEKWIQPPDWSEVSQAERSAMIERANERYISALLDTQTSVVAQGVLGSVNEVAITPVSDEDESDSEKGFYFVPAHF